MKTAAFAVARRLPVRRAVMVAPNRSMSTVRSWVQCKNPVFQYRVLVELLLFLYSIARSFRLSIDFFQIGGHQSLESLTLIMKRFGKTPPWQPQQHLRNPSWRWRSTKWHLPRNKHQWKKKSWSKIVSSFVVALFWGLAFKHEAHSLEILSVNNAAAAAAASESWWPHETRDFDVDHDNEAAKLLCEKTKLKVTIPK